MYKYAINYSLCQNSRVFRKKLRKARKHEIRITCVMLYLTDNTGSKRQVKL